MGTEKRQILVVDDVELNRAILAELFQDSYEVLEAENGCQALELLEAVGFGSVWVWENGGFRERGIRDLRR